MVLSVIAYNLVIDNKRIENAKAEEFKDFFASTGTYDLLSNLSSIIMKKYSQKRPKGLREHNQIE